MSEKQTNRASLNDEIPNCTIVEIIRSTSQIPPRVSACKPLQELWLMYALEYSVNGTAIPDVDFDIGESYAGLIPISKAANESSQLYFWFFPSENPAACDEILIWLNGGV